MGREEEGVRRRHTETSGNEVGVGVHEAGRGGYKENRAGSMPKKGHISTAVNSRGLRQEQGARWRSFQIPPLHHTKAAHPQSSTHKQHPQAAHPQSSTHMDTPPSDASRAVSNSPGGLSVDAAMSCRDCRRRTSMLAGSPARTGFWITGAGGEVCVRGVGDEEERERDEAATTAANNSIQHPLQSVPLGSSWCPLMRPPPHAQCAAEVPIDSDRTTVMLWIR